MNRSRTVVVVGIVAACIAVPGGSAVARPVASSRIVFAANRLPSSDGEIYRITSNGRRLDLSASPALDIAPAVSPDGRWVAFLSGRGGVWAFYLVGTDGRGLHRISAELFPLEPNDEPEAAIVWAPNSRNLAAEVTRLSTTSLYLGDAAGALHAYTHSIAGWTGAPTLAWSPDSQSLAYSTDFGSVRVVSAAGKSLWSVPGSVNQNAWSADDRLAVSANSSTIAVYDATGRVLGSFTGNAAAWAPGGTLLASGSTYAVQIRREGVGKPILRWPSHDADTIQWISSTRLRVFGAAGWVGFDVAHDRKWGLSGPATVFNSVISESGQVVGEQDGKLSELLLSRVGSNSSKTVATGPFCPENEDFTSLAFIPRGLGIIYQTNCISPSGDIYSINPDGTGLRQLTHTPANEMEPSLSPDGRTVVYAQNLTAGKCDGCAQTLWRVPAGGGTPQQLTHHSDQDAAPFDQNPSWSPNGSEIAFQNSGAAAPIRLLTMPATGGATRDLKVNGASVPVWGPKLIAYADESVPHLDLKTIDPATGAVQTVATGGGGTGVEAVAWSKAGRLAYLYGDPHNSDALVSIVGSKTEPLDLSSYLPAHSAVAGLAWSPDGTRFAFVATDRNGNGEIYTIGTNGSGLRQLTKNIGAVDFIDYESTIGWR